MITVEHPETYCRLTVQTSGHIPKVVFENVKMSEIGANYCS